MIRFHKSFFDPYYQESFYRDLKGKKFGAAFAHLFVACLFGAFIAALVFYAFEKNKVEQYILETVDTISNEYPPQYKVSINSDGMLESNITPVSFFNIQTAGKRRPYGPSKLITVDSNQTIATMSTSKKYDAYYVLLHDGYVMTKSGRVESYKGFEGFVLTRSLVEIKLEKLRMLTPFIPRILTILIFFTIFILYPIQYLFVSLFIAGLLYLIFNYWFKEKLTYKDAYTLSVFAGGTVLFIQLLFIGVGLPIFPLFTFITGSLFIILMHRNAEYFPIKTTKVKEHIVRHFKNIKKLALKKTKASK